MKISLQLLVFACSLFAICYSTNAAGTCQATISLSEGNSWITAGVSSQLYDISVSNTGSCPITSLFGFFAIPSSGSFSQTWNYDDTNGEITSFGDNLAPGQSFTGAGFVVSGGVTPTLAFNTPMCPSSCTGTASSTSAGSSSTGAVPSSTTGSSTGANSTTSTGANLSSTGAGSSTSGAASSTTGSSVSCNVTVTISARAGSSFLLNGIPSQIYDLVITNIGAAVVSNLEISIIPVSGTQVVQDNKWNLVQIGSSNMYTVNTFGALTLNAQYLGAGFVLSGTNSSTATPAVAPFLVSC